MDQLISKLKQIPNSYKPIPFWSWNDCLDEEELLRQIRWMKAQGIGGFFMHARGGLKTPYLSEEWMRAIDVCCDEAQLLDMDAWAYDENGWPSGFAGGKLLEDPANRDMYLTHTIGQYDPSANVSYLLSDDALIRVQDGACAGTYLNVYFHMSASTVDILNPDVVQKFLQITHVQYQQRFGTEFSGKVAGFFTDEPQYYRADTPYTPMLETYFREVYHRDILDHLGLLFVEKDGYRTFRYQYWLAMQRLMLDSFARQVYDWCGDHGVRLTGHYVEEPTMGGQLMCCGGVMPFYEYEHIPGIDWLGSVTENEVSPRQLNSAAQQLGKKQALTETFGCCGWNITPAELKRVAGFQYACGVNMMCHHLLPYSEHGQRKRDYPAHFNSINPWIDDHFKDFNDYFSRVGYLLSESKEPVNVAMLHPMRSAYFNYKRGGPGIPKTELDPDLQKSCRILSSRGIGYHFLDETLLEKHGFVDVATIGCGQCAYTYLVIPKVYTMGQHTENLIRQFMANGGKVLLLDEKPQYLEGETYDYGYLCSNCTLEEIVNAQPCVMQAPETELYCTYRVYEEKAFLFIQNASAEKAYTQNFLFRDGTTSFVALDPVTYQTKQLPLTLTLDKNESLLLFPSNLPAPIVPKKKTIEFRFSDADVEFQNNFLTLDTVRYSKDGLHYSNAIFCSDLQKQLLKERYNGPIWLRYDFEIQKVPDSLRILAEQNHGNHHMVNGQNILFDKFLPEEPCVQIADISRQVHSGMNQYETMFFWHQSEETYYALFGEGVTESLKNCIAYDGEIEAVYLAGHFGIYCHEQLEEQDESYLMGYRFYIGAVPDKVSEPVADGFPFFRGELTLSQALYLAEPDVCLSLPGDYLTAKVFVNDQLAGDLYDRKTVHIGPWAKAGENTLRVSFTIGNRNLLGPLHSLAPESFIHPSAFERNDIPSTADGQPGYKFRRFYKK